jgi:hypothetical protein
MKEVSSDLMLIFCLDGDVHGGAAMSCLTKVFSRNRSLELKLRRNQVPTPASP